MSLDCYAETERVANEGIELLRDMGERGYLSTSMIYLADANVSQDRPEEAETTLREAEEHAAEDDAVTVIGISRVRAKIMRRQARLDGAEPLAREAIAVAERTDYLDDTRGFASGVGRDPDRQGGARRRSRATFVSRWISSNARACWSSGRTQSSHRRGRARQPRSYGRADPAIASARSRRRVRAGPFSIRASACSDTAALIGLALALFSASRALQRVRQEFAQQPSLEA